MNVQKIRGGVELMMDKERKERVRSTVQILMQLDERSLLLIDSGARLLAARQDMERKEKDIAVAGSNK